MDSDNSQANDKEGVICLDSSQESSSSTTIIVENYKQPMVITENDNSNKVTVCEKSINFDKTLPPGAAPDGFILLDESLEEITSNNGKNHEKYPEDAPLFRVIFRDKSTVRRYKKNIQDFLRKLVSEKANKEFDDDDDDVKDNNEDSSDLILNIYSWTNEKEKEIIENRVENRMKNNTLFIIDTEPRVYDEFNIPAYGKKYETVLKETNHVPQTSEEAAKDIAAPKLNCFNCLGNHNLRDCTEPRNQMEINKNRKEFTARNFSKNVRYHVDDDTKFDNFKPGLLSQELRKALGLADNQLPRHIYKMRILGYPPGWLEEARLQHSGLNLYNSEGLRETEIDEEQGEIFTPESRDQYDIKKIYDFPGYNVPPPPGTVNAQMWNSEEQEIHSKEAMLAMMDGRKVEEGYKRKKLKKNIIPDDAVCLVPAEMEVEQLEDNTIETIQVNGHFIPPIPDLSIQPPPLPPQDSDSQTSELDDSSSRVNSPSLIELEDRKKRLLEALDDSTQSNPGLTPPRLTSSALSTVETPVNSCRIGRVTSIELGTPLIQSTSPFTKLPSSESFSKDICDVINFENLPNSTGKYEKMSGILHKIRDTLSSSVDK